MAYTVLPATDNVTFYDAARDQYIQNGIAAAATTADSRMFAGAKGTRSTVQAVPNNTLTAIVFSGTEFQVTGTWWEGVINPSRITVPAEAAGKVLMIIGGYDWVPNATGVRSIALRKNGTATLIEDVRTSSSAHVGLCAMTTSIAVQGDYYELVAYQNTGGSLNTQVSGFASTLSVTAL
jgi:hypothetical protein